MMAKKLTKILGEYPLRRFSSVGNFDDIPSPRRLPLIGTTLSLLLSGGAKKLHKYMDRRHVELGPIFKDNVGPVTAVFLADPDEMRAVFAKEGKYPQHIKPESWLLYNEKYNYSRGLFFMEGEEWLGFRRIMNKILLKGNLSWIDESCDVATNVLIDQITHHSNKEFRNIEEELYKWSLDVMVAILVGANTYQKCTKDVEKAVRQLASNVHLIFETTCKLQLLPAKLAMKYELTRWKNFEKAITDSLNTANELLNLLGRNSKDGLLYKMNQAGVTDKDVRRIIVDLILSAGDTTAYTMAWLLFLIAKHKSYQNKLRENLKLDTKMSILKNIVKETLRLYPVAPFLTRILPEKSIISGYHVPENTLLVMSIYTSGRSEKYFKNPSDFLPERWDRGRGADFALQQASMPFGIGARSCIGRKIAETQLQMTLSKIVQNFEVEILNEVEIDDILKMVSTPSKPLKLIFNKLS